MLVPKPGLIWIFSVLVLGVPSLGQAGDKLVFDVVIYGATPGGIAAAIPIARRNPSLSIALITPFRRVGGMMTNGLTHPDFRTFEARTGLFREMNRRVEGYYWEKYGADSEQLRDSLFGTHAGPEVNFRVYREMIGECPGIEVFTQHRLTRMDSVNRGLTAAVFRTGSTESRFRADFFVDATYEGDLLAAAGVAYRIGREGRSEFGESLAPANADKQLQGYNFRITMTDRAENRTPVPKPRGYDRSDYLPLLTLLRDDKIPQIFGDPYTGLKGGIYKRQTPKLPNGKRDINDVSHSIVRLSLPQLNDEWPEGDVKTRQEIFDTHLRHNFGMLYFLQNDPEVPRRFQKEASKWGLCRDEWTGNKHMPEQLYVREGRRMIGRYLFTQKDTERSPETNDRRAIFHADAIAMGDYGPNCHGTNHDGPTIGGRHTGEFYKPAAPYQIPYGTILPKEFDNLAVPVAASSSHVGFCALRLEPIWMSLGQAAGEAIAIAIEENQSLPEVLPARIRERLHQSGCATIYTSDVPEESDDFAAVQWWGSEGGMVALDRWKQDTDTGYGERGKQRIGQYHEAFPGHEVGLDQPLPDEIRQQWDAMSKTLLMAPPLFSGPVTNGVLTRGDYIRAAWEQKTKSIGD